MVSETDGDGCGAECTDGDWCDADFTAAGRCGAEFTDEDWVLPLPGLCADHGARAGRIPSTSSSVEVGRHSSEAEARTGKKENMNEEEKEVANRKEEEAEVKL